jgi:hypothetical protein
VLGECEGWGNSSLWKGLPAEAFCNMFSIAIESPDVTKKGYKI